MPEDNANLEPAAPVDSTPEPVSPQASIDVPAVDLGKQSQSVTIEPGGDNASASAQDTVPAPAAEIHHTVADPLDSNVSVEHNKPEGFVSSAGDPMAAAAAGPVTQDTHIGGSQTPDTGDGQVAATTPTTLEQPTADLASVGVGLGTDSGTVTPVGEQNQSVADPTVPTEGHGGPPEVSQIINTVHPPEGDPIPSPVESKWGMEKAPNVDVTVAEGLGSRIKRLLGRGPKPIQVTTSTVPNEAPGVASAPSETPAPTSNPV